MVVNSFQIELDGSGGEIHFVFPYAMLEPHRERLENQGHSKASEVDRNWVPNLQRRLLQAEVTVNCAIAERSLSLKEVLRLKEGDVIPVDMPDSHLVYAERGARVLREARKFARQSRVGIPGTVRFELMQTNRRQSSRETDRDR